MRTEADKKRIRDFLDLVDNDKYQIQKYSRPVLVYTIDSINVMYSIWEEDMLKQFGLENVDGWDHRTDVIFCPDWISGDDEDEDFDDEDDDF